MCESEERHLLRCPSRFHCAESAALSCLFSSVLLRVPKVLIVTTQPCGSSPFFSSLLSPFFILTLFHPIMVMVIKHRTLESMCRRTAVRAHGNSIILHGDQKCSLCETPQHSLYSLISPKLPSHIYTRQRGTVLTPTMFYTLGHFPHSRRPPRGTPAVVEEAVPLHHRRSV